MTEEICRRSLRSLLAIPDPSSLRFPLRREARRDACGPYPPCAVDVRASRTNERRHGSCVPTDQCTIWFVIKLCLFKLARHYVRDSIRLGPARQLFARAEALVARGRLGNSTASTEKPGRRGRRRFQWVRQGVSRCLPLLNRGTVRGPLGEFAGTQAARMPADPARFAKTKHKHGRGAMTRGEWAVHAMSDVS